MKKILTILHQLMQLKQPDGWPGAVQITLNIWMPDLKPHSPKECYYFSRVPKRVNRVVDISNYIDKKVEACMLNVTKGPAGHGEGRKLMGTS